MFVGNFITFSCCANKFTFVQSRPRIEIYDSMSHRAPDLQHYHYIFQFVREFLRAASTVSCRGPGDGHNVVLLHARGNRNALCVQECFGDPRSAFTDEFDFEVGHLMTDGVPQQAWFCSYTHYSLHGSSCCSSYPSHCVC